MPQLAPEEAETVAIYGRRGSGKTTLAMGLIRDHKRVIAFDPNEEFTGKGWTVAKSRNDIRDAMIKGWRHGFRVSYTPPEGREIEALHWLASMLWEAQVNYKTGHPEKVMLFIEEAHTGLPVSTLPDDKSGMVRVIRRGRHRGIEVIAVTQTPATLSPSYRGNAVRSYVFPLGDHTSRNSIISMIGPEYRATLRALPDHHFLLAEGGTLRKGKTSKTGKFTLEKMAVP